MGLYNEYILAWVENQDILFVTEIYGEILYLKIYYKLVVGYIL